MLFDREQIIEALVELAERLAEAGEPARIRVLGGAAIALCVDRDGATADIEALFSSSPAVTAIAAAMALERNWPPAWLNDSVKMYASHFDHTGTWETLIQRGDVVVSIAPIDLLFAMKLNAARGARDSKDIDILAEACGITSVRDAEAIFDVYFPRDEMKARARRQLDDRFPSLEV